MSQLPENPITRVFFALWPTAAESMELAEWQAPLKDLCGGRAMSGKTLHATLVFIGEIERTRLEALKLAAQEVGAWGFELHFENAFYWGHNHVVYAAPASVPQQLMQLVSALEERLRAHRFKFDCREYKPHVTLLRNARWTDASLPAMQPVCWQIGSFALVQSAPQGGRADYRVLARFPLGSSGG